MPSANTEHSGSKNRTTLTAFPEHPLHSIKRDQKRHCSIQLSALSIYIITVSCEQHYFWDTHAKASRPSDAAPKSMIKKNTRRNIFLQPRRRGGPAAIASAHADPC